MVPEIHYSQMSQEEMLTLAKQIVLQLNVDNRKKLSDCLEGMRYVSKAISSQTGNRASTIEGLIKPLTLYAINSISKNKSIDPELECVALYDCPLSELSEDVAQQYLAHLRAISNPSQLESVTA